MNRFLMLALVAGLCMPAAAAKPAPRPPHWVSSWAASQQIPKPSDVMPAAELTDATVRQVVHLSIGGTALRLWISNTFGTTPLHLSAVHIATPAGPGAIDPGTDRVLTFAGHTGVTIPAGASYVSDPVPMTVTPFSDIAVSIHYDAAPSPETAHPGSRATTYIVPGDHVSDATLSNPKTVEHWFQISAIDVAAPPKAASVVVLGDSITDGHAATTNGNDRWTDELARQFAKHPATRELAVLNAGLGGNEVLEDNTVGGPGAMSRLDRDVFSAVGVRYLIVLEGINDIGVLTRDHPVPLAEHAALAAHLIEAYQQIVAQAHAHGIKVYCSTILPFAGNDYYHPSAVTDGDRAEVNAWVRIQHQCDGVIDFDKVMRDPAQPDRLNPAYDSGDHLHPGPAGYREMGDYAAEAFLPAPHHAVRKLRRHK